MSKHSTAFPHAGHHNNAAAEFSMGCPEQSKAFTIHAGSLADSRDLKLGKFTFSKILLLPPFLAGPLPVTELLPAFCD